MRKYLTFFLVSLCLYSHCEANTPHVSFTKSHACGGKDQKLCILAYCTSSPQSPCHYQTACPNGGQCLAKAPVERVAPLKTCVADSDCTNGQLGLCRPVNGLDYDFSVDVGDNYTTIYEVCLEAPRFKDVRGVIPSLDPSQHIMPAGWTYRGVVSIDNRSYVCWDTQTNPLTMNTPVGERQFHFKVQEGEEIQVDNKTYRVEGAGQSGGLSKVKFRTASGGSYYDGSLPGGAILAAGQKVGSPPAAVFCNSPEPSFSACQEIEYLLWDVHDSSPTAACSVDYDAQDGSYSLRLDTEDMLGDQESWTVPLLTSSPPPTVSPVPTVTPIEGGGGGNCFLAGTQVVMADSNQRAIEDIRAGDHVLSVASDNNLVPGLVTNTIKGERKDGYLLIVTENGSVLKLSRNHPLKSRGKFIPAYKLTIEDKLVALRDGKLEKVAIQSITRFRDPVTVFNLEISNTHTFLAEGVLVHNRKKEIPLQYGPLSD